MTVTDRIFQNVAELSVPNFFITVEFSVMGNEMPEHIESFVLENIKLFFMAQTDANLSIQKEGGVFFHFLSYRQSGR